MNNTISVLVLDPKVERLLRNFEKLHLIRILEPSTKESQQNLSEYAGKLPDQVAEGLRQHVAEGRGE